ncbi:cobalamin B12-binding domain-containing protein [Saccharothrix syringae]|uniref:Methylmalonyl-CoA mutase n=1 Tax=Saccharothrix syringae TaxID=103733 RepID=A0A5Q0H4R5_SACSY|nr:cobalamin-dependent protein [Saccharothrix syringae]QFZ21197.1 methylmalonyl-CoA mutase [Saccharothrix syringae]
MGVSAVVAALRGRKAIVTKLGMDAHWRGAIVVANALRDAGMDVVYLGHTVAAELAAVAVQEDPVLVGLSTLSGNHLTECASVMAAFREAGLDDVVVVAGGTIPPADRAKLLALGVDQVFGVGSPLTSIVDEVAALVTSRTGTP